MLTAITEECGAGSLYICPRAYLNITSTSGSPHPDTQRNFVKIHITKSAKICPLGWADIMEFLICQFSRSLRIIHVFICQVMDCLILQWKIMLKQVMLAPHSWEHKHNQINQRPWYWINGGKPLSTGRQQHIY